MGFALRFGTTEQVSNVSGMAKRAGKPPWPVTLVPKTDDVDLQEVVDFIRTQGFTGLCGVDPDETIDMSIRASNPTAARERAESLLEPNYTGLFRFGHPML